MNRILYLLMLIPGVLVAQQKGIRFESFASFPQLKKQAAAENKFIFIDCFSATSQSCEQMDTSVYVAEEVGDFFTKKFISTRIQIDSLAGTNALADQLGQDVWRTLGECKFTVFPTFLFFSPEAKLVHIGNGYKSTADLIKTALNAMDPSSQYYTLLNAYKQGKRDYVTMPYLANMARSVQDSAASLEIAHDYINNYLLKLNDSALFKAANMEFIAGFTGSKDKAFDLFYRHADQVDKVTRPGYSQDIVDYIISVEEIDRRLWKNGVAIDEQPDWDRMFNIIAGKFNADYADRTLLDARLRWYASRKEWSEYCKNVVIKVEKYGPYGPFGKDFKLNGNAWELFLYSTDKDELMKALSWSDSAIKLAEKPSGGYLDTYANLLYKLGRTREAIKWEEKAVMLEPGAMDIRESLEKMKKREPTWPSE